jgi:predicted O-methyltransferase YrrM
MYDLISLTMKNQEDIDEHLLTLFSLTVSMKPKTIVELGVRTARSTYAFLSAASLTGSKVISVDLNQPQPSLPIQEEWKEKWTFYQKDALKFLEEDFPNLYEGEYNIIYIDDWHTGDHVRKELQLIEDYVQPHDLILLHDLMYGHSQPRYRSVDNAPGQWASGGPYKPVSELDLSKWEYATIPRCHGMTILRKKADSVRND